MVLTRGAFPNHKYQSLISPTSKLCLTVPTLAPLSLKPLFKYHYTLLNPNCNTKCLSTSSFSLSLFDSLSFSSFKSAKGFSWIQICGCTELSSIPGEFNKLWQQWKWITSSSTWASSSL
ncbi:hypothetical protein F0562_002980 [Nyssa sinensis]|uniref:Uncharacterized protein n=1 Tax=Nyssa sinensis TaxID=561372 RepID=A0A5J5BYE2_9ASTE|nr:hypothetical protein F0562_002980 [Nyssa sinensis]